MEQEGERALQLHEEKGDFKLGAWKKGPKAPKELQRGSSTVIGNIAYFTSSDSVNAFDWSTSQWSTLAKCPYGDITLANVNGQLTTIGGWGGDSWPCVPTNKLFTYSNEKWMEYYPPMPTKRRNVAVLSTNTHVIVIGGNDGDHKVKDTEILHIETQQWSTTSPIPIPTYGATTALCGDTLYLMGGIGMSLFNNCSCVLTCNIMELLRSAHPADATSSSESTESDPTPSQEYPKVWHIINTLFVGRSSAANIQGHLVAIGGHDGNNKPSDKVYGLNCDTNEWSVVSHMTMPRSGCLIAVFPDKLFVVGGCNASGQTDETEFTQK